MQLIESDINLDNSTRDYKHKNINPQQIVDSFQRSGMRQARISYTCHEYKNAYSCRSTFANAIRRMNVPHIRVQTLNGRVYLINTLAEPGVGSGAHLNFYRKRSHAKKEQSHGQT
ncbi:MAG: hypothetical protein IJV40_14040 [Oscillospiraceae bacterium]|nr:hypothetical protein [Oscillospiraceae bacterium]